MPSGYKRDLKSAQQLLDEKAYTETLVKRAEAVVTVAEAFAPVGTKVHKLKSGYVSKPGDYRRGLKVVVRGKKVYASATDFKSHWIEWGSINNTPSAPLRRGARALGLRLDEKEKPR